MLDFLFSYIQYCNYVPNYLYLHGKSPENYEIV